MNIWKAIFMGFLSDFRKLLEKLKEKMKAGLTSPLNNPLTEPKKTNGNLSEVLEENLMKLLMQHFTNETVYVLLFQYFLPFFTLDFILFICYITIVWKLTINQCWWLANLRDRKKNLHENVTNCLYVAGRFWLYMNQVVRLIMSENTYLPYTLITEVNSRMIWWFFFLIGTHKSSWYCSRELLLRRNVKRLDLPKFRVLECSGHTNYQVNQKIG